MRARTYSSGLRPMISSSSSSPSAPVPPMAWVATVRCTYPTPEAGTRTQYVQYVGPWGKPPCASGTYPTREAGTRSVYVPNGGPGAYVSAQPMACGIRRSFTLQRALAPALEALPSCTMVAWYHVAISYPMQDQPDGPRVGLAGRHRVGHPRRAANLLRTKGRCLAREQESPEPAD